MWPPREGGRPPSPGTRRGDSRDSRDWRSASREGRRRTARGDRSGAPVGGGRGRASGREERSPSRGAARTPRREESRGKGKGQKGKPREASHRAHDVGRCLSGVLRHGHGLRDLRDLISASGGWALVRTLVGTPKLRALGVTPQEVLIAAGSDQGSGDGRLQGRRRGDGEWEVRATSGHSLAFVDAELLLVPSEGAADGLLPRYRGKVPARHQSHRP